MQTWYLIPNQNYTYQPRKGVNNMVWLPLLLLGYIVAQLYIIYKIDTGGDLYKDADEVILDETYQKLWDEL